MHSRLALSFLAFAALSVLCAQSQPVIKKVPLSSTPAHSGQEMFSTYCAACHGKDGRGKGPAAPALKTMPTDLTTLTAHNNGKFPEPEIYHAIAGDGMTPAHGSVEMPVWGDLFKSLNPGTHDFVQLRIVNLTTYIKSIQRN
jgi:mono/diheme cytochrome c family protein